MATEKKLTGRVPREAVKALTIPRLPPALLEAFRQLGDLTGAVSDAMDQLGMAGAIPASVLPPSLPAARMVGQAITVRNVERRESVLECARSGIGKMGEHEAYNLAEAGDVIVIEGLTGASNMGGMSATLAARAGCAGAVIDGSYRDPGASRERGFPIWARGVTPITGKWRLETVEINGLVRIAGVPVAPGDLVVADEAGIAIVPFRHVHDVLAQAQHIDRGDARQSADIASGADLATLAATKYK